MSESNIFFVVGHNFCSRQGNCPLALNGMCDRIGYQVIDSFVNRGSGKTPVLSEGTSGLIVDWRRRGLEICHEYKRYFRGEGPVEIYRSNSYEVVPQSGFPSTERRG